VQVSLPAQTIPQPPQLFRSFVTFVSHPLAGLPSQFAKPAAQAVTTQMPPRHAEVACARLQTWPHPPQLFGSVWRLVQTPAQLVWPLWQLTVQVLLLQTDPGGQTTPQLPQFDGSTLTATHLPAQSSWPDGQAHAPLTHV
jgi:hypothetical protein